MKGRRFLPDGTLLDPVTSLVPVASAQHGTALAGPLTGTQYLVGYDRSEPANANGGVGAYFRLVDFTKDADATPPLAGQVNDGPGPDLATQPSLDTLEANWSGFDDPESGIFQYEWAIGTTAGGTEVQPFTAVGTQTRATATGLALEVGKVVRGHRARDERQRAHHHRPLGRRDDRPLRAGDADGLARALEPRGRLWLPGRGGRERRRVGAARRTRVAAAPHAASRLTGRPLPGRIRFSPATPGVRLRCAPWRGACTSPPSNGHAAAG